MDERDEPDQGEADPGEPGETPHEDQSDPGEGAEPSDERAEPDYDDVEPDDEGARQVDPDAKPLTSLARLARQLLPGDSEFGDTLSTSGGETPQVLARRISEAGNKRPSALRELGLGALQVYQAISDAYGPSRGEKELAVLFTDLVGFSKWSLRAGDDAALALLRAVDGVQTPAITDGGGTVVKRLGDGMMAVFANPADAVMGAVRAVELTAGLEVVGHRPKLRAGIHLGEPRKIGSDYVGVDVNVAARVAEAAKGGEVLVSGPVKERLADSGELRFRRKLLFRGKGTPTGLAVYAAAPTRAARRAEAEPG